MANCGWMVRDSTMVTIESVWETTIALSSGTINDPYDLPFPQNGAQNAHLVMCRISNGEISATGHPYHFVFCSRVGFSGSADRMTLFPVLSNPRWRPWHDMTEDIDKSWEMSPLPNCFGPWWSFYRYIICEGIVLVYLLFLSASIASFRYAIPFHHSVNT